MHLRKYWLGLQVLAEKKLKPATVTQCLEGSASRGQSPEPSASRVSRIQARLEVTLCITEGAPALFSWLVYGMVLVYAMYKWIMVGAKLNHLDFGDEDDFCLDG